MRRLLTGDGMGMVRQLNHRLVPCPECLVLCHIDRYRISTPNKKQRANHKPGNRNIVITCPVHNEQRIRWEDIDALVARRQESLYDRN